MSEFIFAIIGLIVGGTVGVLVGSMCHVSKMADEDAERLLALYIQRRKEAVEEVGRCPYCGSISGGDGI